MIQEEKSTNPECNKFFYTKDLVTSVETPKVQVNVVEFEFEAESESEEKDKCFSNMFRDDFNELEPNMTMFTRNRIPSVVESESTYLFPGDTPLQVGLEKDMHID